MICANWLDSRMKKTQLLMCLFLSYGTLAVAQSTVFLPSDKIICTEYLNVPHCHLAQCVQELRTERDSDKLYRIGCALMKTQPKESRQWLEAASWLGHTEAMFMLAQSYEQSSQLTKAWFWYEKAANCQHIMAQVRLAERYYFGQGTPVNMPNAIYWYSQAGNNGYLPAQILLGDWYFAGSHCEQNFSIAAYWYELAAKQGDPHAAFHYGAMLSSGNGVNYNETEAIKWLTLSANLDNLEAQSLLGRYLYKLHRYCKAMCWLKKAAQQGDVYSMTTLARIYRYGQGVSQDFRQSVSYLERAAMCGHTQAQAMLGLYYNQGIGVPKNYQFALKWYEQAGRKGNALAQFNLSTLYANGKGTDVDLVQAYAWASLAADSGLHSAIEARRLLSNQMTHPEVLQAQCLASQLVR